MLDTKYGLKYSMPHSVVHIVDNSMRVNDNQNVIVDDPSLYASIVVTGAPMGADNEVISINRTDVLNVAYNLGNLSSGDINKYGQTITYPGALLDQNVPIKFMRVTPEGSTYAFSCLLIQWRWDAVKSVMHVRFKTTSGNHNNGLPIGIVHSSFKNPARLNAALVRGFANDSVDENDGTGSWKQRVFMTVIAAGRGKEYNYFNYSINYTQQSKRPANVRYLFSTIDTRTDLTVEQFYGSLVNQNNGNRADYIETANVQVNQRVKGSSILIPTINEAAVNELYNEYMYQFKTCINSNILPSSGGNLEYVKDVYATTSINLFDPIYGRYIYNGDSDVKLPYFQVDMFDLDIIKLEPSNRLSVVLDGSTTVKDYVDHPSDLYRILDENTYGVSNGDSTYHVGDIFTQEATNPTLTMITTINQYTGSVTSIPITSIKVDDQTVTVTTDAGSTEKTLAGTNEIFKGCITVNGELTSANMLTTIVNDMIGKRKIVPRKDSNTGLYYFDPIIVIDSSKQKFTWTVVFVSYKDKVDADGKVVGVVYDETTTKILTKEEIYKSIAYPSNTITSFATRQTDINWNTPGATIIDIEGVRDTENNTVRVYVNGYNSENDANDVYVVSNTDPFVVGVCPTSVSITKDIVNSSYDTLIYSTEDSSDIKWVVKSATLPVEAENTSKNYKVGDTFKLAGIEYTEFKVTKVNASGMVVEIEVISSSETSKVVAGTYTAVETDPPETDPESGEVTSPTGLKVTINTDDVDVVIPSTIDPVYIQRYVVSGTQGSIFRIANDPTIIPSNYYSSSYGINPSSEMGGISVENGYAGFFDDEGISEIEFKWRYSELLVRAFRGQIDPRIQSPSRVPAKFLFDGGFNTIVGQTILPYMTYKPVDIINASTIYTDDEKEAILLNNNLISNIKDFADIDVKQAMYDLMEYRCYQGIPDDKRPIGPGSGLSLHLDSGETDANTAMLINESFTKRFTNPNASWDIGGYVSSKDGVSYTYVKRIVDNLFGHIKRYSVNKPFTGKYTNIPNNEYISFFPDIDATDWEMRELLYNSGGNAWVMDVNGNLQRKSQRTLYREGDTSDLIQENNMRTLSQLVYLLQNKIDSYLLEYNDDGVLKTLKDDCDNMFTNWVGNLVQGLDIQFQRDINPLDGGEIVVCYCNVTFRGLILRVPIIVNVQRRTDSES